MKLVVGNGYPEIYNLENANGKTIDMINFVNGKDIYCTYISDLHDSRTSPRVFERNGLRFCGTLRKYSNKTLVCVDTEKRPLFFVTKDDLTKDTFAVDFLVE